MSFISWYKLIFYSLLIQIFVLYQVQTGTKMSPERKETLLGLQRQILSLEVNLLLNNFTVDRTWTKPI